MAPGNIIEQIILKMTHQINRRGKHIDSKILDYLKEERLNNV